MLMSTPRTPGHIWRRLRKDTRGLAGIEFALVVSALLLMLLGLCDVVPTFLAYTHNSNSASTAADTAGQFVKMQSSDMVNVYSAASDVLAPFSSATQNLRITNVFSDGNGNAKVYWSCGIGSLPPYTALSAVTSTPNGVDQTKFLYLYNIYAGVWLNGTNTSYIVVESTYTYTAPTQFVLKNAMPMKGISYYLPRSSSYVGFPWDGNPNDSPTVPTAATHSSSMTLSNGVTCSYAY
jgi:Flp pilus assembly protein TadG